MARFPRGVPPEQGHGSRRQFRRNPESISPGLRALSRHVAPCSACRHAFRSGVFRECGFTCYLPQQGKRQRATATLPRAMPWARSGEHRGLPVLPPRFTVIEIATGANHGTWDRWEDVVVCLALAKLSRDQGGADPGYVEHRPVSGAGVRKLVCRTLRALPGICAFAPCAAHSSRNRPSRHIGEMRSDVSRASRRLHICVPGNMDPA